MTHKEAVNDLKVIKEFFEQESGAYPVSLEYAIKMLKNELSADRPRGEWIWHEDEDICNCSECEFEIDATGCIDPMEYVGIFRYCPNCGARMKGADDE